MKLLIELKDEDFQNNKVLTEVIAKQIGQPVTCNFTNLGIYYDYPIVLSEMLEPIMPNQETIYEYDFFPLKLKLNDDDFQNFASFVHAMRKQVGINAYIGPCSMCVYFKFPEILIDRIKGRKNNQTIFEISSDI
jgi:hypothetical protein